jgi:hypothetical protein
MSIVLQGSTSGSVTLQEPAVAGTTVLDLPAVSGTILTTTSPKAGNVIQVVQATYSTETTINSTSYVDSGLSASITPTSASNKILVIASMAGDFYRNSNTATRIFQNIVRTSTQITEKSGQFGTGTSSNGFVYTKLDTVLVYLDSPNTTSSTTYKVQGRTDTASNSATIRYQESSSTSVLILMEIAA